MEENNIGIPLIEDRNTLGEDFIDILSVEDRNKVEDYVKLESKTPKRIQIKYEISKRI